MIIIAEMATSWKIRFVALVAGVTLSAAIAARASSRQAAAPGPCPDTPVPTVSPQGLDDVCIPDGFTDIPMEYFDDFSWRAFLAFVWPAATDGRGKPAKDKPLATPGPRVFETYKSLWEVFHRDGSDPVSAFSDYDAAVNNACGVSPRFGDLVIGSFSGIDDIGQAGNGALDPPLVAQNGRYVRTLTFFNQIAFDHIVANKYYLRNRLPDVPSPRPPRPVIEFPLGAVAIKTSWIDVAGLPDALVKRFYTRTAVVRRPGGTDCSRITVGLVGMHVVQKTSSRPQWIWSTFEQKDNVPPAWPDSPGHFTFHDGSPTPMPTVNPLTIVPLPPEPVRPFNVIRNQSATVHTRTDLTNFEYQKLVGETPWRYYKLVMTQWPRLDGNQATPVPAAQDGTVPHTFPGVASFSAFTNVTMETFDQGGVELSCMNCHNRVRMTTDFMWTVFDHAYPPRLAPAPSRTAKRD
jgi:hypothetical protein